MIACGKRANSALTAHDHGSAAERAPAVRSPARPGGASGAHGVIDDAAIPEVSSIAPGRHHLRRRGTYPGTPTARSLPHGPIIKSCDTPYVSCNCLVVRRLAAPLRRLVMLRGLVMLRSRRAARSRSAIRGGAVMLPGVARRRPRGL